MWSCARTWLGAGTQLQHMHTQQLMSGVHLSEKLDESSAVQKQMAD